MHKIVITGANGFLGSALSQWLSEEYEVVGLVRNPPSGREGYFRPVIWDGHSFGDWVAELEGASGLINLAGRSVNCRYDQKHRDEILRSRVESTAMLGKAIASCANPPSVWINSSTATIYRHAMDRPQDERTGEMGEGFSVEVATAWEESFFAAQVPGEVRKIAIRTAIVLGNHSGTILSYFRRLAHYWLGGKMGSGRQMVSWIHVEDFCRAIAWLLSSERFDGIANVAAPQAVTNAELMRAVRDGEGRSWGLPAARWMLELGAWALRTETELILKSRWVVPTRLEEAGFAFKWSNLREALAHLSESRKS